MPIALFSSGSVVGYVVAAPLIAILTIKFGWRAAFLFTGLLGLVWLAAWLTVYLNPLGFPRYSGKGKAHALLLSQFISDAVSYFYAFWIPEYLMPFVAAAARRMIGGRASDLLIQKGIAPGTARRRILYISAASPPWCIHQPLVSHYASYCAVFVILGFMHVAAAIILWSLSTDRTKQDPLLAGLSKRIKRRRLVHPR